MISKIAISGYRSLREVVIGLSDITVVTGANGSGKSSTYRALRLLRDVAEDRIIASIAAEGGFERVLWAGPESISRAMRSGDTPVQRTQRKGPVALKLGFEAEDVSYAIDLGLPLPDRTSMFGGDPVIKRELLWRGRKPTASAIIADRRGPGVTLKTKGERVQFAVDMAPYDSMVRAVAGPSAPHEIDALRRRLGAWRFYDQIRSDADSPARRPQVGTRTLGLAPDGADLAAAVATIYEIGDASLLDTAVSNAFPGARLEVTAQSGLFQLAMHQPGMLRPLAASELSDGTLRFILLAAALASPRPAPLLVLNEPESSLHPSVIPALASLIMEAGRDCQVLVVSHDRTLVSGLRGNGAQTVELYKDTGETFAEGCEDLRFSWPAR
ncbi:MAG: AAA family ATPase [Oceanicaulis sp.]